MKIMRLLVVMSWLSGFYALNAMSQDYRFGERGLMNFEIPQQAGFEKTSISTINLDKINSSKTRQKNSFDALDEQIKKMEEFAEKVLQEIKSLKQNLDEAKQAVNAHVEVVNRRAEKAELRVIELEKRVLELDVRVTSTGDKVEPEGTVQQVQSEPVVQVEKIQEQIQEQTGQQPGAQPVQEIKQIEQVVEVVQNDIQEQEIEA